jgi:hypothetical protein
LESLAKLNRYCLPTHFLKELFQSFTLQAFAALVEEVVLSAGEASDSSPKMKKSGSSLGEFF